MTAVPDSLRLALGTLTRLPVPPPRVVDRRTAGLAMSWAPVVGTLLALVVTVVATGIMRIPGGGRTLLAAVVSVTALAWLTRGLHLDGLADTADALGSRAPAERALQIARQSDIGPFGVIAIALVLGIDVVALSTAGSRLPAAIVLAVIVSRVALVWACTPLLRPARSDGLGAMVAGTVSPWTATGWTTAVVVVVVTVSPAWLVAVGLGAVCAALSLWRCSRRFGGITGDVLGATVEVTVAAVLIGVALVPS